MLVLDLDLRSLPEKGETENFKETANESIQSLNVYIQSCNTETFVKSMWSDSFRPSASLFTDKAFANEYNQLVAVIENNMHQCNSPICQYRIGVYSYNPSPVFFKFRASLQHQASAMVLPLGIPMLGYISRKPQVHMRRPGTPVRMFVADYFAIRVWKPNAKAQRFMMSVQVGRITRIFELAAYTLEIITKMIQLPIRALTVFLFVL